MARKLKVYQTSIGFFDLAIAAPSMKAALELWGADSNLFHQGFARESTDPKTVKAAMDNPGVVLKRPVGTNHSFAIEAELPKSAVTHGVRQALVGKPKTNALSSSAKQDKSARKASVAFERENKKRQATERREEAKRAKERERRDVRVRKATDALDAAKAEYGDRMRQLQKERAEIDDRADAETAKWEKTRLRLEAALQKART